MSTIWPPERAELAKQLWLSGISATVIAIKLNAVSRHSIIGLAWRNGWKRTDEVSRLNCVESAKRHGRPRAAPTYDGRPIVKTTRATKPKGHLYINQGRVREGCADQPLPKLRELAPTVEPRHWMTRRIGECAFPIERDGETLSCCAPVGHDNPTWAYCKPHRAIMFAKTPPPKPYDPNKPDGRRHNGFNFAAKKRAVNE